MKAADVMVSNVITVNVKAPIGEVAVTLLNNHISAAPVVDEEGGLVGIVSEGDLMRRQIVVLRLEKEITDAALFARGLVYGNPLIDQIRARGGADPDRIVDALAQALRVEFGTDPGRMTLQAIIFSASRR